MLCWVGSLARHQKQKNGIEERHHLALASGTAEVSYTPGCHGLWSRDFGFVVLIGALGLLVGKFGAGPSKKDMAPLEFNGKIGITVFLVSFTTETEKRQQVQVLTRGSYMKG